MIDIEDTICAISTCFGQAAIAIIRISGKDAIPIVDKLFHGHTPLSSAPSHTAHYGSLIDQNEEIDQVVATIFRSPHSYTGEDTVEISCHGSLYVQDTILRTLIRLGARQATAGEFTKRAFLNGKIDLTQAEAVADIIASNAPASNAVALQQLNGKIRNDIHTIRTQLLQLASLLEMELDFSDQEDVKLVNTQEITTTVNDIISYLHSLLSSFSYGNALKNGIRVAIIGETNAGKSTLLNKLLQQQRAIVSPIPGTTRDTVEDTIVLQGFLFRLIDTAGLRETNDTIEMLGIQRTKDIAHNADIILYVKDISRYTPSNQTDNLIKDMNTPIISVWNKMDKLQNQDIPNNPKDIYISLLHDDIEPIKEQLVQTVRNMKNTDSQTVISNIRHYEALQIALNALQNAKSGLENNVSGEFIAQDLNICLNAFGEITGKITSQEILQNIFSRFCIGK